MSKIEKHEVKTYEYNPSGLGIPYFIVIDQPYVNTDYIAIKVSGPVKFYRNNNGVIKVYFDPNEFPTFERIVATLDNNPLDQLQIAFANLRGQKRAGIYERGIIMVCASTI